MFNYTGDFSLSKIIFDRSAATLTPWIVTQLSDDHTVFAFLTLTIWRKFQLGFYAAWCCQMEKQLQVQKYRDILVSWWDLTEFSMFKKKAWIFCCVVQNNTLLLLILYFIELPKAYTNTALIWNPVYMFANVIIIPWEAGLIKETVSFGSTDGSSFECHQATEFG